MNTARLGLTGQDRGFGWQILAFVDGAPDRIEHIVAVDHRLPDMRRTRIEMALQIAGVDARDLVGERRDRDLLVIQPSEAQEDIGDMTVLATLKTASKGLPNTLLRDLNAVHDNTTFSDLAKDLQATIAASVRAAFVRLHKEGYSVSTGQSDVSQSKTSQRDQSRDRATKGRGAKATTLREGPGLDEERATGASARPADIFPSSAAGKSFGKRTEQRAERSKSPA